MCIPGKAEESDDSESEKEEKSKKKKGKGKKKKVKKWLGKKKALDPFQGHVATFIFYGLKPN